MFLLLFALDLDLRLEIGVFDFGKKYSGKSFMGLLLARSYFLFTINFFGNLSIS